MMTLPSKLTTKILKKISQHLCDDFFDGVEPPKIRFADINDDGQFVAPDNEILLRRDLARHPDLCMIVIMHELVHFKLEGHGKTIYMGMPPLFDHGTRFGAEIVRLFEAGAYDGLL